MRKRIHTIIALAAAAALCAGCSEKSDAGETHGRAIDFSCGSVKSRVQDTDADNIASFRVSAVWTKAAGNYVPKFMDGQYVERNGNVWEYSPVVYMPPYGAVDFFAYSPADAAVSRFKTDGAAYDQVSLTYDVTTDHTAQHDFMVAEALEKTTTPIELNFRHVLSSVQIKAQNASVASHTFRIREVRLLNLHRKGILTGTTSADPGKATVWAWGNQQEPTTYAIAQSAPVDVPYNITPNDYVTISDSPLMVLPQSVNKGNKTDLVTTTDIISAGGSFPNWMLGIPKDANTSFYVAVTYELVDNLGSITELTTAYLPLSNSDGSDFTFAMGAKYVFHIDLAYPLTRSSGSALPSGASVVKLHIAREE